MLTQANIQTSPSQRMDGGNARASSRLCRSGLRKRTHTYVTSFSELGLSEPLCRALAGAGYSSPTPVQSMAIPHGIAGRDILAVAQTGTGKTAAFGLPLLQALSTGGSSRAAGPRALVLAPTRELAIQIGAELGRFGKAHGLRQTVVIGGVRIQPQIRAIAAGTDILIATPGRLLDLMQQGCIQLQHVRHLVLDEADRMLDMGFLPQVRRILAALATERQTLLFSATMPTEIVAFARLALRNHVSVDASPNAPVTVEAIEQRLIRVVQSGKPALLNTLLKDPDLTRVLVFTRTKHGADRLCKRLCADGVQAVAIHGNKSQSARQSALAGFRNGNARVLVATDIAARGIDVTAVSHVINFDLPMEPESYVHRIGRTARAGATGVAISFCDPGEAKLLHGIQKQTRFKIAEAAA
ncbi:MAG: DEAD/DEAH box helicase [Proteobacteria bacterium]|nr:DEAD/DEAH box helicase [Pseudomonadota bacterium]